MANVTAISRARRTFYPSLEPYHRGRLAVSALHEIYFEECGNPNGKPVVVLHGGPGGGLSPFLRRLHHPQHYRIILFDQRGCGASTPHACIAENTTWDLVADIEKLRLHCGVEQWQVFGGSWGSTLALAYAQTHTACVTELILRGIFTLRQSEINWFYQWGASEIYPEEFDKFLVPIPISERHDLVAAYHRRLSGNDAEVRVTCAKAWSRWEGSALSLLPDARRQEQFEDPHFATAFAAIECHYFFNKGFFAQDGALLENMHKVRHLPGEIIQGRYDMVTPAVTANELAKRWPLAIYTIIDDAGHATLEPGITDALIRATERFVAIADTA